MEKKGNVDEEGWERMRVWICIFLLVIAFGCDFREDTYLIEPTVSISKHNSKPVIEDRPKIAFVSGGVTDPLYSTMKYASEEFARQLDIDLIWTAAMNSSPKNQIQILQELLGEKLDALIVNPLDMAALNEPLKKLMQKGVPVFTIGSEVSDSRSYIANVVPEETEVSQKAVDSLLSSIHQKGKIAIIGPKIQQSITEQRKSLITQYLEKFQDVEILPYTLSTNEDIQKLADMHPDLKGVVALDAWSSEQVNKILQKKNGRRKIKIISFEATSKQVQSLKQDKIVALIAQNSSKQVEVLMKLVLDYLHEKKDFPKNNKVDSVLMTTSKMNKEEMKKWTYRDD